jgi:hypothetical protein
VVTKAFPRLQRRTRQEDVALAHGTTLFLRETQSGNAATTLRASDNLLWLCGSGTRAAHRRSKDCRFFEQSA